MKILIERTDGFKAEITTPQQATLDAVLETLTLALQAEGFTYVTGLNYNTEEDDEFSNQSFDTTEFVFEPDFNLDLTEEAKRFLENKRKK